MNAKQIGLGCVLIGFSALTVYTVLDHGYLEFFQLLMANSATITAGVDLVIALVLVLTWLVRDAQERGVSPVPYVLLTLALGSVGPLLYLIRRAGSERSPTTAAGTRHATAH